MATAPRQTLQAAKRSKPQPPQPQPPLFAGTCLLLARSLGTQVFRRKLQERIGRLGGTLVDRPGPEVSRPSRPSCSLWPEGARGEAPQDGTDGHWPLQVTHVVCHESCLDAASVLQELGDAGRSLAPSCVFVRRSWVNQCLAENTRISPSGNTLSCPPQSSRAAPLPGRDHPETLVPPGSHGLALQAMASRAFNYWHSRLPAETRPAMEAEAACHLYRQQGLRLAFTRYFCYNCGAVEHGAESCCLPLRGTGGNAFELSESPYRVEGFPATSLRPLPLATRAKFLCAREHPVESGEAHPNATLLKAFEELKELVYERRDDHVSLAWWAPGRGPMPTAYDCGILLLWCVGRSRP
jgi:hypothetical protein